MHGLCPCTSLSFDFQWIWPVGGIGGRSRTRKERGHASFPSSTPRSPLAVIANIHLQLQPSSFRNCSLPYQLPTTAGSKVLHFLVLVSVNFAHFFEIILLLHFFHFLVSVGHLRENFSVLMDPCGVISKTQIFFDFCKKSELTKQLST